MENLIDDTLSLLGNLRKLRWRPKDKHIKECVCSVILFVPKIINSAFHRMFVNINIYNLFCFF